LEAPDLRFHFLSTWLWGSGLCCARGYVQVVCGCGAHAPLCLLNFLGSSRALGVVSRLAQDTEPSQLRRALPSVEHFVSSHTDSRLHKYSRILYPTRDYSGKKPINAISRGGGSAPADSSAARRRQQQCVISRLAAAAPGSCLRLLLQASARCPDCLRRARIAYSRVVASTLVERSE
jgi:hypothetical protein